MKNGKIVRNILLGILIFVLAVLLILQVGVTIRYWDYFTNTKMIFHIPGLTSNFVPQGFAYLDESDTYLMSGYMSDGDASRVYIRDGDGKNTFATLHNADLSAYTAHAGGICVNGEYAYFPGDNGIDVFSLRDILGGKAPLLGTIPLGFRVDFCSFENGYLMVGNFYYEGHYDTPEHHQLVSPAGDKNTGIITVLRADAQQEFGIDPNAVAAVSIREKVQGMCVTDGGTIVLSTSWGLTDSVLYCYDWDSARTGTLETATGDVPLYYLDSENLTKTIVAPPMAEEMVYRDGRVYVLNESACNKYIFGRLIRGDWVYGYELP